MASLDNISQALDELNSTLDTELTEIAQALADASASAGGPTTEEVDAVAQRVRDLQQRVANIIP